VVSESPNEKRTLNVSIEANVDVGVALVKSLIVKKVRLQAWEEPAEFPKLIQIDALRIRSHHYRASFSPELNTQMKN